MEDDIARSVPAVTPMSPLGLDLVMQISTGARTNSTRRWGSIRGDTPRSTPRSALASPHFTSPRSGAKAALEAFDFAWMANAWRTEGHEFLGKGVARTFGRKRAFGTIVKWLPADPAAGEGARALSAVDAGGRTRRAGR